VLLLYVEVLSDVTLQNCQQQDGGVVWESCGVFAAIMVGCFYQLYVLMYRNALNHVQY
jgi:hypothetical protein